MVPSAASPASLRLRRARPRKGKTRVESIAAPKELDDDDRRGEVGRQHRDRDRSQGRHHDDDEEGLGVDVDHRLGRQGIRPPRRSAMRSDSQGHSLLLAVGRRHGGGWLTGYAVLAAGKREAADLLDHAAELLAQRADVVGDAVALADLAHLG